MTNIMIVKTPLILENVCPKLRIFTQLNWTNDYGNVHILDHGYAHLIIFMPLSMETEFQK